jgi:hypothetical protein
MSALDHRQTYAVQNGVSALLPLATAKADSAKGHVRLTPESGHVRCTSLCLLWAKSGHGRAEARTTFAVLLPVAVYLLQPCQ